MINHCLGSIITLNCIEISVILKGFPATEFRQFDGMEIILMSENDNVKKRLEQGIRQALFCLSRSEPVPPTNPLLNLAIVHQWLADHNHVHSYENTQSALADILEKCVNEFGLQEPEGLRQKEFHLNVFEVLSNSLMGRIQVLKRIQSQRQRSYDRFHSAAVRVLAECIEKKESELAHTSDKDSPDALRSARIRAQQLAKLLRTYPKDINLLAISELGHVVGVIADYEYHPEASEFLKLALTRLDKAPRNLVVADLQSQLEIKLAHSLINLDCAIGSDGAIASFRQALALAEELRDPERVVHSTHMLGLTHSMVGDWQNALAFYEAALDKSRRVSNPLARKAWIERDIVDTLLKKGDHRQVQHLMRDSLSIRERLGDVQGVMMTHEASARVLIARGHFKDALTPLWKAYMMSQEWPLKLFRMIILVSLVDLHLNLNDVRTANEFANVAEELGQRFQFWHQLKQLDRIRTSQLI
ncbi:hypothetical protein BROC_00902 [Candidatus Brocadiaceae bacterium]|nr:hypothetical protein BROC_00902 [Candidatus Brocadiaceae bacterium]